MNGAFYRPGTIRPMRPLRRRATTSRVVLGAALAVLLGGGAAAALAAVHRSPRFLVRRVVLTGVPEPHRNEVEALSDPWIGRPLLSVDLDGAIASLSSRPWVARVWARRVVPDTVSIQVEPRAPVALARRGDDLWTVDQDGLWLAAYTGGAGSPRFVVLDPSGAPSPQEGVVRGARLLARLRAEDPELLARISEVEVLSQGFAVVDAPARLKLRLGDDALAPGRAFARWRAFLALAPELTRYGLLPREVDLRFENRIVLKAPATEGPRSET
ncbi:MAG: FtsQ-type POTRA domain-containing protein [Holophagales bacterium]|nr:FtsQ-type POTRA domain-containing protein [Holophagales bacterium]MBK9963668.1 FtsQ-type POTRA domain-containing protein [Holophagales bacterium]